MRAEEKAREWEAAAAQRGAQLKAAERARAADAERAAEDAAAREAAARAAARAEAAAAAQAAGGELAATAAALAAAERALADARAEAQRAQAAARRAHLPLVHGTGVGLGSVRLLCLSITSIQVASIQGPAVPPRARQRSWPGVAWRNGLLALERVSVSAIVSALPCARSELHVELEAARKEAIASASAIAAAGARPAPVAPMVYDDVRAPRATMWPAVCSIPCWVF